MFFFLESEQESDRKSSKAMPAIQERRKSYRIRTPVKYNDFLYTKANRRHSKVETESSSSEEDDGDDEVYEVPEKPTTLFTENRDVAGSDLFTFRTPKKRDGMARLAAQTPKTPKLSSATAAMTINSPQTHTPRGKARERLTETTKTPHRERAKVRKGTEKQNRLLFLAQYVAFCLIPDLKKALEEEESGTDFSTDEDPDYKESGASESSESDSGSPAETSEEEGARAMPRGGSRIRPMPTAQQLVSRSTRKSRRLHQTEECLPQSDNYFSAQSTKKVKHRYSALNWVPNCFTFIMFR